MRTRFIRHWRLLAGGIAVLAVLIQALPYGYSANPPVVQEPVWDSAETLALARRACFDCHSNETEWPAYAHVAPVSWLIRHDVDEGRAMLNFSEWQRPQEEAGEAPEEVMEGEMPLPTYELMHAHARLSADERQRLAQGLLRTIGVTDQDAGE